MSRYVVETSLDGVTRMMDTLIDAQVAMTSGLDELLIQRARQLNLPNRFTAEKVFDTNLGASGYAVWDHYNEEWETTEITVEDAAEQLAKEMNENACVICHQQCSEAHSQGRIGRVCEDCTDEYIDENGELNLEKSDG